MARASVRELQNEIERLEDENEQLQSRLDAILDIASEEEEPAADEGDASDTDDED